ncbi:MAG TPA: hypothetical protein VNZ53_25100 [Steroidobacteraceae bacterium]|jgi:hypothetical protein|nr:hypothetical protein [Steroidobacteraceae bacterium]
MNTEYTDGTDGALREVVIGRNSRVWRTSWANRAVSERFKIAIGHADLPGFQFTSLDRVWVFAYSRVPDENSRLLAALEAAAVREVVYVSTAATIVTRITRCYEYPTIKQVAEDEARERLNARVLTLGLVVARVEDLPPGLNATTLQSTIEEFLLAPHWPYEEGRRMRLFEPVAVPFARAWEACLHRAYDRLQWGLGRWPCALRPLDAMLRALGIRWYGYVNLSNRLWNTTTS